MHVDILVVIVGYAPMNTMLVWYFKGKDNETNKISYIFKFIFKKISREKTPLVNKSMFILGILLKFGNPSFETQKILIWDLKL